MECVKFFVRKGMPINSLDQNGCNVLGTACEFAKIETIRALLELGANPNMFATSEASPLVTAFGDGS
jgi:ankyrin repeat protein